VSQRRWRTPLIIVLAGAAALAVRFAVSWRGLAGLVIVAGVVLAGAVVAWVVVMPARLAPPVPPQELAQISDPKVRLEAADARLRLRSDLRNGALQTLAVVAVLAGAVLGFRQLALGFQQLSEDRSNAAADRELTRQGQASERFTRAISQLGDKRVETRIGGIYGLAQIAEQAPDNLVPVGRVLLAYINSLPRPKPPPAAPLREHAPDVEAALSVLTQYDQNQDGFKDYWWLVRWLDLHALGLSGVDFRDAYLTAVDFRGADLRGAGLIAADLSGVDFRDADLRGAVISGADLRGGALLRGADLRRALLRGADLRGADLSDADLGNADLRGADLRGAATSDRTKWPKGFDWRRAGVKLT